MLLESVRALKAELAGNLQFAPRFQGLSFLSEAALGLKQAASATSHLPHLIDLPSPIALGISINGINDFRLAVRIQRSNSAIDFIVKGIIERAKGEVDVRRVGEVFKLSGPLVSRTRPLLIGYSVGGAQTTGTVGGFVKTKDGKICILSNNHVLANENDSKIEDPIIQPGSADNGQTPADLVARLTDFVPLNLTDVNLMDCAIAALEPGIAPDPKILQGLGNLAGIRTAEVATGTVVAKIGRTTGLTKGSVTAFEVDGILPRYAAGILTFNQQIEIASAEAGHFASTGDSGSLVVDGDNLAVGLLFAATAFGGQNGYGLTYATPISRVLQKLNVDLYRG
jgi:hypothetical protein